MADSAVQTKQAIEEFRTRVNELNDEITLGNIHGDAIKSCIEKLNNACQCQAMAVFGDPSIVLYSKSCYEYILKPVTDTSALDAFDAIPIEDSEKHLKKLIKHAKTPMERKMYEKKLNALYKKRKRKI